MPGPDRVGRAGAGPASAADCWWLGAVPLHLCVKFGGGLPLGPHPKAPFSLLQEPQPLSVEPREGPQAGGTTLTINGTDLDTGSKEDVRVTIGGVPCNVWVSPAGLPGSRGRGGVLA